ncbi:hypothetical protein [Flavobacterium oreochromis]|uniref:hypothetical protein n=1 Tax=Flavobacterium oreochromis TaxID=2906078 RepID=UPI00385CC99A
MKTKHLYLLLIFFSIVSNANAQTAIPNGKVKLIEFTNDSANFNIPEGKAWVIYSVFSDYIVDGVLKFNNYEKKNFLDNSLDVRIFIKDWNGLEKTNFLNNIYGTQLYRSTNASTVIPFPIVFPEKTTFSLIILKGDIGSLELHNGKAYISFIEIDN